MFFMRDDLEGHINEKAGSVAKPANAYAIAERVDERFQIIEHLYTARTSDGFKALDRSDNSTVLLWLLRYGLASTNNAVPLYVNRLERLRTLELPCPKFRNYGVDASRKAYLATEFVEGTPCLEVKLTVEQQLKVFLDIVSIVAKLHKAGIVLKDIGEDSFILAPDGKVLTVSLIGGCEVAADGTTMLPPPKTLYYLSPEHRSGVGIVASTDVYALGVYAYRLFTGRYAVDDVKELMTAVDVWGAAQAPSKIKQNIPPWIDDIVKKCVSARPYERFGDASQLLQALKHHLHRGGVDLGTSQSYADSKLSSSKTIMIRPATQSTARRDLQAQSRHNTEPGKQERKPSVIFSTLASKGIRPLIGAAVIAIAVFGVAQVVRFLSDDNPDVEVSTGALLSAAYVEPLAAELKAHLAQVADGDTPVEDGQATLQKISDSSDPLSFAALVAAMKASDIATLRPSAQLLVLTRIEKAGLPLSSDVVLRWFQGQERSGSDSTKLPYYDSLFEACDPVLPVEKRRFALSKAFSFDRLVGLQLAAALALDDKSGRFAPSLRQFMSDEVDEENLMVLHIGALILGNSLLAQQFEGEVTALLSELAPRDLAWILVKLSERDSNLLFKVAEEALKRNIIPPFQAIFLRTLVETDRQFLPAQVRKTLIRGARGELQEEDLVSLARWMSLDSEPVLLAICAISSKENIALAAFDALSSRTLNTEPARGLIKWIKKSYWEYRTRLVKAVGILGSSKIAQDDQINYAFDVLMPFAQDSSLLNLLVGADVESLIVIALERLGEISSHEDLLPLLRHDSKQVRIGAIRALKGRNDLTVLRGISRAYDKERDEDVRSLYEELHWVTRKGDAARMLSNGE